MRRVCSQSLLGQDAGQVSESARCHRLRECPQVAERAGLAALVLGLGTGGSVAEPE